MRRASTERPQGGRRWLAKAQGRRPLQRQAVPQPRQASCEVPTRDRRRLPDRPCYRVRQTRLRQGDRRAQLRRVAARAARPLRQGAVCRRREHLPVHRWRRLRGVAGRRPVQPKWCGSSGDRPRPARAVPPQWPSSGRDAGSRSFRFAFDMAESSLATGTAHAAEQSPSDLGRARLLVSQRLAPPCRQRSGSARALRQAPWNGMFAQASGVRSNPVAWSTSRVFLGPGLPGCFVKCVLRHPGRFNSPVSPSSPALRATPSPNALGEGASSPKVFPATKGSAVRAARAGGFNPASWAAGADRLRPSDHRVDRSQRPSSWAAGSDHAQASVAARQPAASCANLAPPRRPRR